MLTWVRHAGGPAHSEHISVLAPWFLSLRGLPTYVRPGGSANPSEACEDPGWLCSAGSQPGPSRQGRHVHLRQAQMATNAPYMAWFLKPRGRAVSFSTVTSRIPACQRAGSRTPRGLASPRHPTFSAWSAVPTAPASKPPPLSHLVSVGRTRTLLTTVLSLLDCWGSWRPRPALVSCTPCQGLVR